MKINMVDVVGAVVDSLKAEARAANTRVLAGYYEAKGYVRHALT